jgi:hypothetical protein
MRIIDAAGIMALSRAVPTGRLLWVDAVKGNDALAVREALSVPLKTLAKARDSAVGGDTIMVLPGSYNEHDLLRNGVNWYFFPGAVVHYTGGGVAIFSTEDTGVGAFIGGYGEFESDATTVIDVSENGANLLIQARKLTANDAVCVSVTAPTTGTLKLHVMEKIKGINALSKGGLSSCVVEADEMEGGESYCIHYVAGNLSVSARCITAVSVAVNVGSGGSGGRLLIDAGEIISEGADAVAYNASAPTLIIRNARIKGNSSAVNIGSSAANKVMLMSCLGLADGTNAITAAYNNTYVQIPGGWAANKGSHNYVKFGSTLTTTSPGGFIETNSAFI